MVYRASAYGKRKMMWTHKKRGEFAEVPEAAGKVALKRALRKRWLTIIIKKGRMFKKGGFLNVV